MNEFPSRRVKESIKTALAMTLAYGLALWFNWDKPQWAGFAVAAVSLPAVGMSAAKAFDRAYGTILAVLTALILLALFPQKRWLFMIALTSCAGICCYCMCRSSRPYFWQVSAWITALETRCAKTKESEKFDHMLETCRFLSTSFLQYAGAAEKKLDSLERRALLLSRKRLG